MYDTIQRNIDIDFLETPIEGNNKGMNAASVSKRGR